MYNTHPLLLCTLSMGGMGTLYPCIMHILIFPSENLGKKYVSYTAKYDNLEMAPVLTNQHFTRVHRHDKTNLTFTESSFFFCLASPSSHSFSLKQQLLLALGFCTDALPASPRPMISWCNILGSTWRMQNCTLMVTTEPAVVGPHQVLLVYF